MTCEAPAAELLVVFVKYPEPGRVKTRLAAGIGQTEAAAAYRELVAVTLNAVGRWLEARHLPNDRPISKNVWIYFDPLEKRGPLEKWLAPSVHSWSTPPQWVGQPPGDLGKRLQSVFHEAFKSGFSSVCAIGTDCPGLSGTALARAFSALDLGGGVVGPSPDGGYYLIGIKNECPLLFANIPWSSPETLSATRLAAEASGITLASLPVLADIDTEEDWKQWQRGRSRT